MEHLTEEQLLGLFEDYANFMAPRQICLKYGLKKPELLQLQEKYSLPTRNRNAIVRRSLQAEEVEFVSCAICKDQMKDLTNHIIKTHKISVEEYGVNFGNVIVSEQCKKTRSQAATERYVDHPELKEGLRLLGTQNITKINEMGLGGECHRVITQRNIKNICDNCTRVAM